MKVTNFSDHLKEKLKDPVFKAGYEAWASAIEDEITPRDKKISALVARVGELEKALKKIKECRWEEDFSNAGPIDATPKEKGLFSYVGKVNSIAYDVLSTPTEPVKQNEGKEPK